MSKEAEGLKGLWGYENVEQFIAQNKAVQEWFVSEALKARELVLVAMNAHKIALPTITPEMIEGLGRQATGMIEAFASLAQFYEAWKPHLDQMKREQQLMEWFEVNYMRGDKTCQIQEIDKTM